MRPAGRPVTVGFVSDRDRRTWPPRGGPWVFDGLLALAAAALSTTFFLSELQVIPRSMLAAPYALTLVHTLSLAARRRFPLTVLAVVLATGLAVVASGFPTVVLGLAILVAVYTVAAERELPVALAGLAAAELALVAGQLTPGATQRDTLIGNALVVAAAWLLGYFVGVRRSDTAELRRRTVELEQAREELARRAVSEERLRIARELHDIVAHSMSVIAVQSGVGAHVIDTQPEEARKALAAVEDTSRSALNELRRLLGVLRQDGDDASSLVPAPGLEDLDRLVAQVGEAGLAVELEVDGARPGVPPGVDLSAYRIVQESLTNVLKHAGPARDRIRARVSVRYGDHDVVLEVVDDGRGAAGAEPARTGHGIAGMRERAAVFGGELVAGPRPGGGFRVAARLPFEAGSR